MSDFSFGPGGSQRFATSSNRALTSDGVGSIRYPSPFFDIAQTYLPSSFKTMLRWCRFYFLTNPLINCACYKMAEYPVTDLVLDTDNAPLKEKWTFFFNNVIGFKKFEVEVGLDYNVYGNAFVSIFYPFIKYLICKSCKKRTQVDKQKYKFQEFKFYGTCTRCAHYGEFKAEDHYIRSAKDIRLIRWNPEQISIYHNDATGETLYYYTVPATLSNDIRMSKRHVVEKTPQVFLEALRLNKALLFNSDNLYHLKRPTIAQKDKGWGLPMILPVLKDTFYLQILRKAQEAIMLEHIVPLRILFPQTASPSSDVYCVSLNTLVETRDGPKPASEVKVGDLLKSHKGAWKKVEAVADRPILGKEKVYRFKVASLAAFPFEVSEEHPILASQKLSKEGGYEGLSEPDWIQAQDLKKGDFVLYPVKRKTWDKLTLDLAEYIPGRAATENFIYRRLNQASAEIYEYFEANGTDRHALGDRQKLLLERGWSLEDYSNGRSAYVQQDSIDRICRFLPVTEDLARLIGIYAAEGSLNDGSPCFALHKQEEEFRREIDRIVGACGFRHGFSGTYPVSENGVSHNVHDILLGSFLKNVCGDVAVRKRLPRFILEAPESIAMAAAQGLLAGDGCNFNTETRRIGLSTVSPHLAVGLRSILLSVGFIPTAQVKIPGEGEISKLPSYQLNLNGAQADALAERFGWDRLGWSQGQKHWSRCGFIRDGYAYLRINEIEEAPEVETVRGFQMAGDRSFCVVGVATHNSTVNLSSWKQKIEQEILRWRCVSPESLVETIDGLKPAKDVLVGDRLKSRMGTFEPVLRKEERALDEGEMAYRLDIRGQRAIKTVYSEEHPIWAAHKFNNGNGHKLGVPEFVEVKDLKVGDYVGYPTQRKVQPVESLDLADYVDRAATADWVYVDHLEKDTPEAFEYLQSGGDGKRQDVLLEHGWGLNSFKCAQVAIRENRALRRMPRHLPFDRDLAWVLGLYAAEGSVGPKAISFALHREETAFVERLNRFFSHRFGVEQCSYDVSENGIQVVFHSVVAAQLFAKLAPGTARTKRLPELVRSAPDNLLREAIRGVLDGDGSYYDDKVILGVASRQLAEDVRVAILSQQIMVGISYEKGKRLTICGKETRGNGLYRVQVSGNQWLQLNALLDGKDYQGPSFSKLGVFRDGFAWFRIDGIKQAKTDRVLTFKVAGDSTFCTWGVATHNCDNNYIPILPLPVGQQTLGAEGKALMLAQEYRVWAEHIIAGMGVPTEFCFGGMSFSGSNVSLRMLENHFLDYKADHLALVRDFIMPKVGAFMEWQTIKVHFKRFKMADDLQRSAYHFQLNQAGKLSDKSLLEETDWDASQEAERIAEESKKTMENQRRSQIAQANIQGEAQLVMQKYQFRAQKAMESQMAPATPPPGAEPAVDPGAAPAGPEAGGLPGGMESPLSSDQKMGGDPLANPTMGLQQIAGRVAGMIDQMPEAERQPHLVNMRKQNPQLYSVVNQELQLRRGAHTPSSAMPLPMVKAPRRGPEAMTS